MTRRPSRGLRGRAARAATLIFWTAWPSVSAAQATVENGAADRSALLATLDSIVISGMRDRNIRGGTLALVQGGRVLAIRGFGFADTTARPVHPDSTTFGISSISKVFTTIGVLQLVDRGLLALDDPVRQHVPDVPLEGVWRDVRVADLLTHSAGFDDANIGIGARTPRDIIPLGEYLREMPPRVRPPGDVTSYSNHGFALAGLVVERVARQPFAEYVRANLLTPLGMRQSGFEQPLPAPLEGARALPLRGSDGADGPTTSRAVVPRIYFNDAPASAMYTTARDMARFMVAFLDTGTTASRLLTAPSRARMLSVQFTNHSHVRGLTFGLRGRRDGGFATVEQGGDWQDYSGDLLLAPGLELGLFLALTDEGADQIAVALWRRLIDPTPPPATAMPAPAPAAPPLHLARLTGTYRSNRYSRTTLARLGVLTGSIREERFTVTDGELRGVGTTLRQVQPDVYLRDDTRSLIAFRLPDREGAATHLFFENAPYAAYERVAWFDDRRLHLGAFIACVVIFVAGLVSWRARHASGIASRGWARVHERFAASSAAGGLGLLVATAALVGTTSEWAFQYGIPAHVRPVLVLAMVVAALSLAAAVTWVVAIATRDASRRTLWWGGLQVMAAVTFVALLRYWNFL